MKRFLPRFLTLALLFLSLVILASCFSLYPSVRPSNAGLNFNAEPTYGRYVLDSGFIPDPQTLDLLAGGSDYVEVGGVHGYVQASAPDLSITYTAGSFSRLYFWVDNCSADTILIINDPRTDWYTDDDSGPGLGAGIAIANPQSGRYDIWVGTYSDNGYYPPCRIYVSELMPDNWN